VGKRRQKIVPETVTLSFRLTLAERNRFDLAAMKLDLAPAELSANLHRAFLKALPGAVDELLKLKAAEDECLIRNKVSTG